MTLVGQIYALEARLVATFRAARAVSPDTAIVPPPCEGRLQRQILRRFTRRRVLVGASDGRCYLDEARLAQYAGRRARGIAIYAVAVVVVVIVLSLVMP